MKFGTSRTTVWVKTEFQKAQKLSDSDARTFVRSVNRYKLDCIARAASAGPGAFYTSAWQPVMAVTSGYTPFQAPLAGSPAQRILTRVCDVVRARRH
jgi:hypothetical protein